MNHDYSDAAQRLSELSADGDDRAGDAADLELVRSTLETFLAVRYSSLGNDELLDLVDEAVARLFEQSRREGALERAGAWLFTVVRRLAIDRLRTLRHDRTDVPCLSDDELARLIDRMATSRRVEVAFQRAGASQDHVCIRILKTWLDLAEELGAVPTSRDVALLTGYSHTTVNDALARFRRYLV